VTTKRKSPPGPGSRSGPPAPTAAEASSTHLETAPSSGAAGVGVAFGAASASPAGSPAGDGAAGPVRRRELPEPWAGRLGAAITVAGLLVATLLALALGTVEAFLAPLRVSGWRVPVSLVLAVVTNPLLVWFAFVTTGKRFAGLLPAGAWIAIWILSSARTTEGDLLLTDDNWVGLVTLFVGPVVFAVSIYMSVLRQPQSAPAFTGVADGVTKGGITG